MLKDKKIITKRIEWDEFYSQLANIVSSRSTCLRHKFGCVIVDQNHRIVSAGYNGAPVKVKHCLDTGCLRDKLKIPSGTFIEKCMAIHAEMNALLQAGTRAMNSVLYINAFPCFTCAKLIINSGIKRVVCSGEYADKSGVELLRKVGIEVCIMKLKK